MKQIENSPIPMLETTDAAEPITEENTDTSSIFLSSSNNATSILKSPPSLGNVSLRNSLKFARGMAMFLAAFSMPASEIPLTIPLMTGTMRVTNRMKAMSVMHRVNEARTQSGAFFPLNLIFCSSTMIGREISETTTARRMYTITLLKYQHIAAPMQNTAAKRMDLANFSVYFSFSIEKKLYVLYFGTLRLYLCINKTDKPLKFNSYEYR